ncbi:STE3-domain-containing protein [Rickenella mellea]|uniref:STE3-domain-containing protein n=1 Tax=Rickenella mellea TaxID=50990 RepID=A0A4Y7QGV8_9AGAM|nr:STE3-domain-containing protein [Rickenella mellea]
MSTSTYPAFPIMAVFGLLACLIPLKWIARENVGIVLYAIWLAVACVDLLVNSIMWHGNVLNHAPVWCDISSRLIAAVGVAIPASLLSIMRRLYHICTMRVLLSEHRNIFNSIQQKRRIFLEDVAIGVGIPLLQIGSLYVVTCDRFLIIEDIGCWPCVVNSWLAALLMYSWPVALGVAGGVYGVLTIRVYLKQRKEVNHAFQTANVNRQRYLRLLLFASLEICLTTPFALVSMILNLTTLPVVPYPGWASAHARSSVVDQLPAMVWRQSKASVVRLELSRWNVITCAVIFFGMFGFSADARKSYRVGFWTTAKLFGFKPRETPLPPRSSHQFRRRVATLATLSSGFTDRSNIGNGTRNENFALADVNHPEPSSNLYSTTERAPQYHVQSDGVNAANSSSEIQV